MVLEATAIVIDNSDWMRNGDYPPSRLEAQQDAVTLLFNAKTQSNQENTVGLLTLAGKSPTVMVTLTADIGKILTALHHVQLAGKANVETGLQIAQLVLKHRQNKHQHQRIVLFVGSPIVEDEDSLVKLAKRLKKNNVAVDVVSFGEHLENSAKLEAFIAAVNNSDNSHLVTVPTGPSILSDVLLTSPIISGEDGPPPGFSSSSAFEFGVDPNLDPELALALRISMEEERARQEKPSENVDKPAATDKLAMEIDEDDEIARAIAMSMDPSGGHASSSAQIDPNLMSSVLSSLPGVNPNDPRIQSALQSDASKKDDSKKKKEDNKSSAPTSKKDSKSSTPNAKKK